MNQTLTKLVINPTSIDSLCAEANYTATGTVDWDATMQYQDYQMCTSAPRCSIGQEKSYVPKFGGEFNMQTNKDGSVKVGRYWITRVIHNNPATIVFWSDGTKTVARTQNGDPYDPTAGLLVCVMKKMIGNDQTQKLLNDWAACEIEEYGPMFGEDYVYTDITMKDVRKKHREK
jgi:hypothetical protein